MQMNMSTYSEASITTDQLKEPGGNPSIDTLLPKACLHEQTQNRNPVRVYDPGEDASETFIGGGGI
jgi:hypothetical protein